MYSVSNTCSVFEEVDEVRFRNTLLEVIEELKMRRQQDAETEETIGSLLESKTTLEHAVEEERRRAEQLQEQLARQEGEMRRTYELQLKELEADRAKASSAGGVEEREMKALKDEVKVSFIVIGGELCMGVPAVVVEQVRFGIDVVWCVA